MKITRKEVEHVAKLARLALRDEEIETLTNQLGNILTYVEKLNELDTTNIEPTSHVLPIKNVLREDEERKSIEREKALGNAPDRTEEFFRVPKVIE
ncbi:MAG: asparaginyl/glutamyl-tRNA amidotransferase subunit C [Nitrospirae bacterium RBG_16_43_11]|nr:MAG: asparaginyl/glutamyl-tRNA amidotransferase subunit C [Nitrospirae bacterium RBG_16_43_11]